MLNKIFSLAIVLAVLTINSATAQVTYIHEDFQGSVAAESNIHGQITKRVQYEPFGEQRGTAISNEPAHTGHVYDADLGLSYMGSRYYDPTIGRFYSDDPVGFMSDNPTSFNRYAYANNNPFAYTDPNGELPFLLIPIIVAIAKEVAATAAESYIESKTGVAIPLSAKSVVKSAAKQIGKKVTKTAVEAGGKKTAAVATKGPLARGRASETRVLNDLGLPKNNAKVSTSEGKAIPDALTSNKSIEIKDCISVSCTKQIRIQTGAARASGRQSVLVTGSNTRVSGPAKEAFDDIIRRPDLGPKGK